MRRWQLSHHAYIMTVMQLFLKPIVTWVNFTMANSAQRHLVTFLAIWVKGHIHPDFKGNIILATPECMSWIIAMLLSVVNALACSHYILLFLCAAVVRRSYGWCWNSLHSRARWLGGSDGRKSSYGAAAAFPVFVPAKQRSVYIPAFWQNGWETCRKRAYFISVRHWMFFPSLWFRFSDRSASRPPSRVHCELQQASCYSSLTKRNTENLRSPKP